MRRKLILGAAVFALGVLAGSFVPWRQPRALAFPPSCTPGDIDGNRQVEVTDAINLLRYIFLGGESPAACPCEPGAPQPVSTVVLVRHAEKDTGADPPLSPEGEERAQRLAAVLAEADVTTLLASDYRRTVETLEPLADRKGDLEILRVPTQGVPSAEVAEDVVERLDALTPGSLAVVAHHSFTIPQILEELGFDPAVAPSLDIGARFDNLLLILRTPGRAPQLVRLTY